MTLILLHLCCTMVKLYEELTIAQVCKIMYLPSIKNVQCTTHGMYCKAQYRVRDLNCLSSLDLEGCFKLHVLWL